MSKPAALYYTAEMVRALPDDGNRYETVYGELLVSPSPRMPHQAVLGALYLVIGNYLAAEKIRVRLEKRLATFLACEVGDLPRMKLGTLTHTLFLLEGDQHVGCAGLRPYRLEERIYELGYHLRPAFWGQGLAQEGKRSLFAGECGPFRGKTVLR